MQVRDYTGQNGLNWQAVSSLPPCKLERTNLAIEMQRVPVNVVHRWNPSYGNSSPYSLQGPLNVGVHLELITVCIMIGPT